jgi:Ca2+-binding RTX toxin-like protein
MATYVFTVAEFNARTVTLTAADDVTIADAGQNIDGLTPADIAAFAANNVDVIDATNDSIFLSTSQLEALGTVRLTAADLVVLADSGAELGTGTLTQISTLDDRNVDRIDVTDNVVPFSFAQYRALGAIQFSPEDIYKVSGTGASQTIDGRASNDRIKALGGNDHVSGGDGNDWVYGGAGKDVLTGGIGFDAFVFDSKPNKSTNLDTIRDFNVADDSVYLDNAIFKKLGKGTEANPTKVNKAYFQVGERADDRNDYLIYNKKTGILYYDADGSGGGAQVEVAKLAKNLKLSDKDFFVL